MPSVLPISRMIANNTCESNLDLELQCTRLRAYGPQLLSATMHLAGVACDLFGQFFIHTYFPVAAASPTRVGRIMARESNEVTSPQVQYSQKGFCGGIPSVRLENDKFFRDA